MKRIGIIAVMLLLGAVIWVGCAAPVDVQAGDWVKREREKERPLQH